MISHPYDAVRPRVIYRNDRPARKRHMINIDQIVEHHASRRVLAADLGWNHGETRPDARARGQRECKLETTSPRPGHARPRKGRSGVTGPRQCKYGQLPETWRTGGLWALLRAVNSKSDRVLES